MNGQALTPRRAMNDPRASSHLVVFRLGERRLALPLEAVDRVERVVEITPLPQAPEVVLGVINAGGHILPVLDLRARFGLPAREMALSDLLVIARAATRTVALLADSVEGVIDCDEDAVIAGKGIVSGLEYVWGVVKQDDEMILLWDLDRLLSDAEEKALRRAQAWQEAQASGNG